jgi:hypothetical protein
MIDPGDCPQATAGCDVRPSGPAIASFGSVSVPSSADGILPSGGAVCHGPGMVLHRGTAALNVLRSCRLAAGLDASTSG